MIIIMIIIIMIIIIMIIIIIYTSHHLPISSLPVSLVGPKFCSLNLLSWVKNGCPQPFSQWAWQQLRLLGRKEAQSCPPDNPEQGIGLQSHWKEWKKAWKKDEKKDEKRMKKGWKRMKKDGRWWKGSYMPLPAKILWPKAYQDGLAKSHKLIQCIHWNKSRTKASEIFGRPYVCSLQIETCRISEEGNDHELSWIIY